MIPFGGIFDLLKVSLQFVEGTNICFKCLKRIKLRSELLYTDETLLSLHTKEKYTSLPVPVRFHIEECLTIKYHLILFLEQILHRILQTPTATPSEVDFLKELNSTLAIPKLSQSETELSEAVVNFLLEL